MSGPGPNLPRLTNSRLRLTLNATTLTSEEPEGRVLPFFGRNGLGQLECLESAVVDALRLAFGTLSVLPAGMPSKVDRRVAGRAMVLAPVVGLVLGGISAGVVAGVDALRPGAPLLAAVLGVVVLMVLSGGLHLDGLADTADGFGSRRDRETMLRIMKQSDIGPFGVASIAGVLLIDVAALAACIQSGFGWQAILVGAVASRLTLPWSCRTTIPSARPDGLGAMVAATVRPITAYALTLAALLLTAATALLVKPGESSLPMSFSFLEDTRGVDLASVHLAELLTSAPATAAQHLSNLLTGDASSPVGLAIVAAAAAAVGLAVGVALTRQAQKLLGGITGDTLGAAVELALPATLLTLALTV